MLRLSPASDHLGRSPGQAGDDDEYNNKGHDGPATIPPRSGLQRFTIRSTPGLDPAHAAVWRATSDSVSMMQHLHFRRPGSPRARLRQLRRDGAVIQFVIAGTIVLSLCALVYVLGQESAEVRTFANFT
jgi:hypothetical protein